MKQTPAFAATVFLVTLIISLSNASFTNLGFADAAEFALTAKLAGIAHAPGFPAYILLAGLWLKLTTLFSTPTIASLVIFSAVCSAYAAVFFALSTQKLLGHFNNKLPPASNLIIAGSSAVSLVCGPTIWHWSHSVEVYGLHLLAFAILVYGLTLYKTNASKWSVSFMAVGVGIGIANHHLTMILFLPFLAYLLWKDWNPKIRQGKKDTRVIASNSLPFSLIRNLTIYTGSLLLLFYGWMFIRAGAPLAFSFGQPDSIDRLIYHLSGGAWIKNTQQQVSGLAGMRFPYFMKLTLQQLGFLLPFSIAAFFLSTKNSRPLLWSLLFYFLVVLIYQLRIDQTADTDAYMILPFTGLTLIAAFGIASLAERKKALAYASIAFPAIHVLLFYPKTDVRKFDLSTSILRSIDEAAPPNSVILIADWTSAIVYTQARIDRGFRKDLTVLNYDLKFTHKDILPRNYPETYNFIRQEYDYFIRLLGERHPQEIYNTGLTLDTPELQNAYHAVVRKLKEYAVLRKGAFMADPKAFVFLSQSGHFPVSRVAGSLVTDIPQGQPSTLTDLSRQQWLTVPHIRMDAAAADKLVDLEAALDFHRREYSQTGNAQGLAEAENAYNEVKSIQRELKKNMPFLFRPPGQ